MSHGPRPGVRHERIVRDFARWLEPVVSETGMHVCATPRSQSVRREGEIAARARAAGVAVDRRKDLRAMGENEQRLYSLDAWPECPYYTDRERAALAWTEAVTRVADGHVPDAVYDEARAHFNEREVADLTLAVTAINAWNRLSIAARLVPGKYKPAAPPA